MLEPVQSNSLPSISLASGEEGLKTGKADETLLAGEEEEERWEVLVVVGGEGEECLVLERLTKASLDLSSSSLLHCSEQ